MMIAFAKRRPIISAFGGGFVAVVVVVMSHSAVLAQDANGTVGATISPPSFEMKANPGETSKNTVRLTNQSANVITYQAVVEDFTVVGQEGVVAVQDEAKDQDFSHWFSVSPAEFELQPKAAQYVDFVVKVPANAEPGGHFASLLFQPKVVAKKEVSGATIVQRLGSLILMTVSGQITEKAQIKSFHSKSFNGSWEDVTGSDGQTVIHIATNEKLATEHTARYFSQGPLAFDLLYNNQGNVQVKPIGTISIYNLVGSKVEQLALDPRNIFPGGERRVTMVWPQKNLWGGYYRAQVIAVYGSANQTLTAETWFFVFPWWALVLIVVSLAVMMAARRRLIKMARVLIKG